MGRTISDQVQRKIFAESMGRCMNPDCKEELFKDNGDISEKAHIIPYYETADNSYDNLIVLCPNCHTNFDKNFAFRKDEVKMWKQVRKEENEKFFSREYETFDELKNKVVPLLLENKTIYENYYKKGNKELWEEFEKKILVNNRILRNILEHNLRLFQSHSVKEYSNLELVKLFLLHIDEFEATRLKDEKNRQVLFPVKIISLFGISPINDSVIPSLESLEALISALQNKGLFETLVLVDDNPYIQINEDGNSSKVFLNDTPRLRQLYHDYKCFRKNGIRLDSLIYALKRLKSRGIACEILNFTKLSEVMVNQVKTIFIYEYCLSKVQLTKISPEENCVIVNLHNWNGESCISKEAYDLASKMNITLLTMDDFHVHVW